MASFVNYTNHPSAAWSTEQREAALRYGEIRDLPFPAVAPAASAAEVAALAQREAAAILAEQPAAVLCQGEMNLCFSVVSLLRAAGVPVFAACSERTVSERQREDGATEKTLVFSFVRFREYR